MRCIWRLEDQKTRIGPYQIWRTPGQRYSGDIPGTPDSTLDDKHPSPLDDGIKILPGGWSVRFGFATLQQLRDWVCDLCQYLRGKGYVISQYEVTDARVQDGGHQVIFDVNSATLKKEEPL